MQSFFSAAIIVESSSWLTAAGILGLLLLQIIFLIKMLNLEKVYSFCKMMR